MVKFAFLLALIGIIVWVAPADSKRHHHRHHCRWYVVHHKRLVPRRCRRVIVRIIKQYNSTHIENTYNYPQPGFVPPKVPCVLEFIGVCP